MLTLNGISTLTFPEEIEMVSLRTLEIKSAHLAKSLPIFRQFTNLTKLDLSENELERINELFYLTNIRSLNLSRNKFSVVPADVARLITTLILWRWSTTI
jgi:Leucine-rich repeat (LRR) protein